MARKRSQHVVPSDGKWAIHAAGAKRATRYFKTQRTAISVAKRIARQQESELVIHGRDGRIREKSTYAKEPFPPKG